MCFPSTSHPPCALRRPSQRWALGRVFKQSFRQMCSCCSGTNRVQLLLTKNRRIHGYAQLRNAAASAAPGGAGARAGVGCGGQGCPSRRRRRARASRGRGGPVGDGVRVGRCERVALLCPARALCANRKHLRRHRRCVMQDDGSRSKARRAQARCACACGCGRRPVSNRGGEAPTCC